MRRGTVCGDALGEAILAGDLWHRRYDTDMAHLVLILYVLAAMRLTRLVNADTILDPVRIRLARLFGPESTLLEFLGCPWCVGFWISLAAAVVPVLVLHFPWWWTLPLGLACSQIVGMLSPWSSDEDLAIETVTAD